MHFVENCDGDLVGGPQGSYRVRFSELVGKYYACVKLEHGSWDFAWHPRPYRTIKAATVACERNYAFWNAVLRAEKQRPKLRKARLAKLKQRGTRLNGSNIYSFRPLWAGESTCSV